MPLTRRYHTGLMSHKLRCLQKIFGTDTLFPKVKLITRHECAQIYTYSEELIWIMHLFSKAELGMPIMDFSIRWT